MDLDEQKNIEAKIKYQGGCPEQCFGNAQVLVVIEFLVLVGPDEIKG
jgi:hypothetical protein